VVTGGGSGIGLAVAERLRKDGFRVATIDLKPSETDLAFAADVTDRAQIDAALSGIHEQAGPVTVLVNAAGLDGFKRFTHIEFADWQRLIDVNLNGAYWMAQACGRVMQPGSSVINIASILGITTAGLPQAAYSASKAGIIGLTRDLAQQWGARKGIRVNALAPGFFKTEMTDEYKPGYLESQSHRLILGRLGDGRELAATAVWLASAAGGYVTGQTIVVDGGLSIT